MGISINKCVMAAWSSSSSQLHHTRHTLQMETTPVLWHLIRFCSNLPFSVAVFKRLAVILRIYPWMYFFKWAPSSLKTQSEHLWLRACLIITRPHAEILHTGFHVLKLRGREARRFLLLVSTPDYFSTFQIPLKTHIKHTWTHSILQHAITTSDLLCLLLNLDHVTDGWLDIHV